MSNWVKLFIFLAGIAFGESNLG